MLESFRQRWAELRAQLDAIQASPATDAQASALSRVLGGVLALQEEVDTKLDERQRAKAPTQLDIDSKERAVADLSRLTGDIWSRLTQGATTGSVEPFRQRWNAIRPLLEELEKIPEFTADDAQDFEETMGELSTLQDDIDAAIEKRKQDVTPTQAERDAQYNDVAALSRLKRTIIAWIEQEYPSSPAGMSDADKALLQRVNEVKSISPQDVKSLANQVAAIHTRPESDAERAVFWALMQIHDEVIDANTAVYERLNPQTTADMDAKSERLQQYASARQYVASVMAAYNNVAGVAQDEQADASAPERVADFEGWTAAKIGQILETAPALSAVQTRALRAAILRINGMTNLEIFAKLNGTPAFKADPKRQVRAWLDTARALLKDYPRP